MRIWPLIIYQRYITSGTFRDLRWAYKWKLTRWSKMSTARCHCFGPHRVSQSITHYRSSEAHSLPRKWSQCRHTSLIMPSLYPGMKLNIKSWLKRLEFNFEQARNRKSAKFKFTTKNNFADNMNSVIAWKLSSLF